MPTTTHNNNNLLNDEITSVNISHLEKLYREVVTSEGVRLGVVDIYLDAPDYTLVFDADEGFTCLDDISRAVVFYCRYYKQNPSISHLQKIESLIDTIFFLQADNGYFYNFIYPDFSINHTHINSTASPNFWTWRAMWALSEVQLLNAPELKRFLPSVNNVLNSLIEKILILIDGKQKLIDFNGIKIPEFVGNIGADQIAVIIASLTNCYGFSSDTKIKNLIKTLGEALLKTQYGNKSVFPYFAFLSWKNTWHAWGNCQSCALLYSGMITGNVSFIVAGKNELEYFFPYLVSHGFISQFELKQVGDKVECYGNKQFPQISYDIRVMVFAAIYAYEITGEISFAQLAANVAMWLFGRNVANYIMYDSSTGRCYDGIDSSRVVNKNSGAESTIEALLILNEIEKFPLIKKILDEFIINQNKKMIE